MLNYCKKLLNSIEYRCAKRNSKSYIKYLRRKGVKIGYNVSFANPRKISIDITRPCLVTIGNNVRVNSGFKLITHDWVGMVIRNKYKEFINSSGKVVIGNNVGFGDDVTILKGVTIGDNCFIGAGSIVTKNIPSDSIVAGVPAKVICSLDEYYNKRKNMCKQEAFEYANCIKERYGREPIPNDFWEEFHFFVDSENVEDYPMLPIKRQLSFNYNTWLLTHKREFDNFEAFLIAARGSK